MPLIPGTRFGPYEIQSALGAGGMGEVYRARDTKLGRDVALKLLPDQFAADSERLARFEREAQVLAALNHPYIAQIYGLEESSAGRALVMELVEGQTLAERMGRFDDRPLPPISLAEALTIAQQITEALEAAHEKGIIHRDLKPANVMVADGGQVKVLDFGLAAVAPGSSSPSIEMSNSPTLTLAATRAGVILGTAAYMAPEQAAGKAVDKRADVWSFGVIVWEMLIGQRLFDGETISHTLADVLRAEIDFTRLPRETPPAIREMLRRCLDRDVRNRLRDIGEARVAIQKYLQNPSAAGAATVVPVGVNRSSRLTAAALGVAAIALVTAAALAFVHFRERPAAAELVRFQIVPPDQTTFATGAVLSPDGKKLAFEAPGPDGRTLLWVRSLDSLAVRSLSGTEGVSPGPFWSPDSRFLAFGTNGFPGRLKKVDASGGPSQTLCEYTGGYREGAWNRDGVILFGAGPNGLVKVSEAGGTSSPVTKVDISRQEIQHAGPTFLPDRHHFLYHRASRASDNRGIYLGSLDLPPAEQSSTALLAADSDPVYTVDRGTGDGFLLFLREGSLLAQRFDGRSTLTGDAMPIAEDVGNTGTYGWFSVSDTGALAFRTGRAATTKSEFVWFDRQGKRAGQIGPGADPSSTGLQLSPDGKRVVVTRPERPSSGAVGTVQGTRLWVAELSRGIFSRLSPGEGTESAPALTPDGRVVFSSTLNGAVGDLYWMSTSGIGLAEPLLLKSPTVKHPNHVSPDGRFLIYDDHSAAQRQDLWILPLAAPAGGGDRKPIPFLVTQADETFGQFSPDGKWVAYYSDESGRREVYVQGFAPDRTPAAAVGKWTISTAGGQTPRWRRDGKELYYLAPDRKLMAVPVKIGPASFEPGLAVPLFEANPFGFFSYDVAADGRFLMQIAVEGAAAAATPVTIVLNWQAGLKR